MEEKKMYHEPELQEYGKVTDITQDASDDPMVLNDIDCWS